MSTLADAEQGFELAATAPEKERRLKLARGAGAVATLEQHLRQQVEIGDAVGPQLAFHHVAPRAREVGHRAPPKLRRL